MNKRKLRRVAIVALVLVLLCNTLGVQAETGAPAVTVSSYEELVSAIDQASNLDTILIGAVIWIPEGASLGDSSKTVILKSSGGYMEIVENTQSEEITSFTGLIFDGAGKELLAPYLRITGAVSITGCTFKNCGVNGAINMSYASCTIKNSSFKDNKNDYGAHILIGYKSTADISNSSFTGGIATVRGGGIYLDDPTSTATLTECTITGNVGAYGGGIANWGSLTLENTLLYANTASVGGADLFSTGSYSMESIEDSKEFYHEAEIEPLSWESDYIDPDYGATCIKLSYEEYIAPVEPTEPVDPEPTEPSTPDPVTPPSGGETGKTDQEPTDPLKVEPSDTENPSSGENEGNKDTEIPSTTDTGEDKKDNSVSEPSKEPDSSQTKEEQEVKNVDNSQHNSTTSNSSSVGGNTTNTSSVSNTDNSRSESSRTENSNNSSTVNNYYQQDKQEPATASTNASQPVNVTVPVTVSTPEAKGSYTATTEAPESTSIADKNINIEAKGVDVKLEITGDSYNISISAPEGQESQIQPVNEVSTVNAPESTTEPQRSPNWIEYITVILLAVLVGLEIKDKLYKEK
ncbi:right-handed parallel beta-helix repeat-containing protein [Coprococcus comes]|uniref:right-handed parallel beta-helix repeat-containing protein n=1 Tax=Coprococcus comes TaxID=410072 RepID=UPI00189B0A2C|nr:right-handed parallel beta-helix repeat-containing protein [Coprococcus comes]